MSVLTLSEVKPHLSVLQTDESLDALIAGYIEGAETHVAKYIRKDLVADYPDGLPANVRQSILFLTASFYRDREQGEIPPIVKSLLASERDFEA